MRDALSRALKKAGPEPKWPKVLEDGLGKDLDYPGYAFRLKDGRTVRTGGLNQKRWGQVTAYGTKGAYVEEPDGTHREIDYKGEHFPVVDIVEAWLE